MADDIRVRYGSTGFEKVNRELDALREKGGTGGGWFRPIGQGLRDAEGAAAGFNNGLKSMIGTVANLGLGLAGVVATLGALTALTAGGATAAFMKFGQSILTTTENFRKYETSLLGALKSEAAVERVSNFAKDYAAKYPAMYGDIMRAMQGLAFIPATRGAIKEGDVAMMKDFMHIVQGMMVMRPDQGVQGSLWALREALAGNLRSLQYRFDIPVASIARSAGMSLGEMKEDPMKMLKGMKSWIDDFVGSDTMERMSRTVGIQLGNIKDKWEMWLDTIGKTGVYDTVVSHLLRLNDAFERFMKSDRAETWAMKISDVFTDVANKFAGIFTKGIDWEGVDSFKGFLENVKKVFQNAKEEALKVWAEIKEPLSNIVSDAFNWVIEKAIPVITDGFLKLGEVAAKSFGASFEKLAREHPLLLAALGGAVGGRIGGLPGFAIGAGAGLLGSALAHPSMQPENIPGYEDIWRGMSWSPDQIPGVKNIEREIADGVKSAESVMNEAFNSIIEVGQTVREKMDQAGQAVAATVGGDVLRQQPGESYGDYVRRFERNQPIAMRKFMRGLEAEEKAGGQTPRELVPYMPISMEGRMGYFEQWSRMGMALAQTGNQWRRPFEETPTGQFVAGKLPFEEWQKTQRVEEFRLKQMEMLKGMAEAPGEGKETYGMRSQAYSRMFDIAMQRGEYREAESYMQKSLEALVQKMQSEQQSRVEDSSNLAGINKNTAQMVEFMKTGKTPGDKSREPARSTVPSAGDSAPDEIKKEVREGGREWYSN